MLMELPQPWSPAQATSRIRAIAQDPNFSISYKAHAMEQITARGLIVSDVLFLLTNGFVHENAQPSTRPDFFKYLVEGQTPNSGGRQVRCVAIPDWSRKEIKIVTVMWVD